MFHILTIVFTLSIYVVSKSLIYFYNENKAIIHLTFLLTYRRRMNKKRKTSLASPVLKPRITVLQSAGPWLKPWSAESKPLLGDWQGMNRDLLYL